MLTRGYSGTGAYCQSKLAQVMFTIDLAAELSGSGVTANCPHPATYMNTTMVRRAGVAPVSTVEEGAHKGMGRTQLFPRPVAFAARHGFSRFAHETDGLNGIWPPDSRHHYRAAILH
jgi:NAD(P)-dependent dehydrogenase (short-subunit alcohol dehydrogenase family)